MYGEVSGKAERFLEKDKRANWITKEEVPNFLKGKKIDLEQNKEADKNERLPYNKERHYYRKLGDEAHRKAMYGHPIKRRNN